MDNVNDDQVFLRDLVKASRQKIHQVKWVDRDGTDRVTRLSQAEFSRLNSIAQGQRKAASDLLREAAHIPVVR